MERRLKEEIDKIRKEFKKESSNIKEEVFDGVVGEQTAIYSELKGFNTKLDEINKKVDQKFKHTDTKIESLASMFRRMITNLEGEENSLNPGVFPELKDHSIAIQKNTDFIKRLKWWAAGFSFAWSVVIGRIVWSWKALFKV